MVIMDSEHPPPFHFLQLAPETRVRIYSYYFPRAILRLTRPQYAKRARVFTQTKVDLILACREIYIESQPIYAASMKLILKNTRLNHISSTPEFSPLKLIQYVELVDRSDLPLDVSCLPSLRVLGLSMHTHVRLNQPSSKEQADSILEGSEDGALKKQGKLSLIASGDGDHY